MAKRSPQTYKSAWDLWLLVICGLASLFTIASTAVAAMTESDLSTLGRTLVLLSGLLAPVLLVWMVRTTDYTIAAEGLRVRSGPFRWKMPFEAIESVEPSKSILSGPAGSLDRLAIKRQGKLDLFISPRRRRAFLDHLATRATHLERRDDRLVPRS